MKYTSILITGGAGFIGSNLCIALKKRYPELKVISLDNLKRRGSELNISRLKENGIIFIHGDIRNNEDLEEIGVVDLLIECSAEPSVMAGVNGSPNYLLNTNLIGGLNCFEYARKHNIDIIFISTSRVYPYEPINTLEYINNSDAFIISDNQQTTGISSEGITESFGLNGCKTLYGATKLSCELFLQEYLATYDSRFIINRYGCIAGPWQMGKVDQGIMSLWVSRHIYKKPLTYIGFGGEGKQVRDFLHIEDMVESILLQIENFDKYIGKTFVIGGGKENSISLKQLTNLCQKITHNSVTMSSDPETRLGDLKRYISDYTYRNSLSGRKPSHDIESIIKDTKTWIDQNKNLLNNIF